MKLLLGLTGVIAAITIGVVAVTVIVPVGAVLPLIAGGTCGPASPSAQPSPAAGDVNSFTDAAPAPTSSAQRNILIGPDQMSVATQAVAAVKAAGMPQRAAVLVLAAGMAESGLRNLTSGDRDSEGFLQQRPSQGWGTPQQVTDVGHATHTFLQHLVQQVPNWRDAALGQAVQTVQGSDPGANAYAPFEQAATQLANQLWNNAQTSALSSSSQSTGQGAASCQTSGGGTIAAGSTSGSGLWPVLMPIPSPGKTQQIPVPSFPTSVVAHPPTPITPQCVAGAEWAWVAAHESDPGWPTGLTFTGFANAAEMVGVALSRGFKVAQVPTLNAMVVWKGGSQYGGAGHVGLVIAVQSDRYEVVEQNLINDESDMGPHWGMWDVRSVAWPDPDVAGFIATPPVDNEPAQPANK